MEGMPLQWLHTVLPVTRIYVIGSVGLAIAEHLGYVKLSDITLNSNAGFDKDQLWKIPLNILYNGTISLNFVTRLYFFARYANSLEQAAQSSKKFFWNLFILTCFIVLYSTYVTNLKLYGPTFRDAMLYIWTKKNSDAEVFFAFFLVRHIWIPWISFALEVAILGARDKKKWLIELSGICIGHLYWFLDEQIPLLQGTKTILRPIWEWNFLHNVQQPMELRNNQEQEIRDQAQGDVDDDIQLEPINADNELDFERETEETLHQR